MGFNSLSREYGNPKLAITPGRKLSIMMSAQGMSFSNSLTPAVCFRFRVMLSLFWFRNWKRALDSDAGRSSWNGPSLRPGSPWPGLSTLTDLRAVVGEELGAEGTGGVVGQIKDPGPGKGLWRRDGFGTFQHDSCVNIAGRMSLGNNIIAHQPPGDDLWQSRSSVSTTAASKT